MAGVPAPWGDPLHTSRDQGAALTLDQKRNYITQYKNLIDHSRGMTIMRLVVETYGKKSPAIVYVSGISEPHLNLAEVKDADLLDRIFNIVKTQKESLK